MVAPIIEILSVGAELIEGRTLDTNSSEIAAALNEIGLSATAFHAVGDDLPEIASVLGDILKRADLCICTGGLGPTLDDLTREAVAFACGKELRCDEDLLKTIREYFTKSGRKMPESNRRQAMIPQGAEAIVNNRGTAPGFHIECDGTLIICLPGVPLEMRQMLHESVLPMLQKRFAVGRHVKTRTLRLFGISESALADALGDIMARGKNPTVGTNASKAIIGINIRAKAETPAQAENLLAETEKRIRRLVGKYIFGEGKMELEEAVAQLMEKHGLTIATAESCTGGMLGAMLTNVPGISRYYVQGAICYSNEAKTQLADVPKELIRSKGAVSDEVARALAEGVRRRANTNIGVGITGIAGPSGGTQDKPVGLVYIAVADERGTESREFRFAGDRQMIRLRAALTALNMTRLRILERET